MSLPEFQNSKDYSKEQKIDPITQTLQPIVTGAPVIALKYNQGIMVGTDTLYSYGSMAKYFDQSRLFPINQNILLSKNSIQFLIIYQAGSGELSDIQNIVRQVKEIELKQQLFDDNVTYNAKDYANYVSRICYYQRNKFNPLMVSSVIAGCNNKKSYLASIDMYGNLLEQDRVLTGPALSLCSAIISQYWNKDCDQETCKQVIEQCFKVLFCRYARTTDKIQLAIITDAGVEVSQKYQVQTSWDYKFYVEDATEKYYCDTKLY